MSDSEFGLNRELRVRLAFAAVAAILGVGAATFTDVSEWIAFAIVVLLGIVAPRLYLYVE
ncbi:hypothetical protein [Halolamina salifodinae]|uniref:Uncharacterized protein n=1 Tax=Halolamina salifodinae TaxID=1202767 RepID=A0A8T4GZ65_9EURY|nr:hypothetical protein [Halolamina salifodinae]MBP1987582.1 hypothetical protein [Halolamina salifodinae]